MSTCQHERIKLKKARGQCELCGIEVKSAEMKSILSFDRQMAYEQGKREGFKSGYAKAVEDLTPMKPTAKEATLPGTEAAS